VVNTRVPALFIIGGIGFSVLSELYKARRWCDLSLYSKLMLSGTAATVIISVIMFALLEWSKPATLGQFQRPLDRLLAS